MTPILKNIPVLFALAVSIAGCNTTPVGETEYNDPRFQGPGTGQVVDDGGLKLFGGNSKPAQDQGGAGLGVNAYLWRAVAGHAVVHAAVLGGPVRRRDHHRLVPAPDGAGERFKATAYIMGRQLRTDGLRVTIFRQVDQGGQWVDAPVAAEHGQRTGRQGAGTGPRTALAGERRGMTRARSLAPGALRIPGGA